VCVLFAGVSGTPLMGPLALPAYWLLVVLTGGIAASTMQRRLLSSVAVVTFLTMLPLAGIRSSTGPSPPSSS